MANSWTLALALQVLRSEVNAAYPTRSKVSDGSIGDAAHSSRKSDHNPDQDRIVCAIDVTNEDPDKVNDGSWNDDIAERLAEHLLASRDPRIKYVIWRGRMFSSYSTASRKAWTWGKYTGPNGHFKHVHVSVTQAGKRDASGWGFAPKQPAPPAAPPKAAAPAKPAPAMPHVHASKPRKLPVIGQGAKGPWVWTLQRELSNEGYAIAIDGKFGPRTKHIVKLWQRANKLSVDGLAGPQVWKSLGVK